MTIELSTRCSAATERLAELLAARLEPGDVVLLDGPLGAGKTCFVRGLARGLGIDTRRVKSPTYAIQHRYSGGRLVLDHYDAYFVRELDEWARFGFDEFLAAGNCAVVEWAERFPAAFPAASVRIALEVAGEEERRLRLTAPPELAARLFAGLTDGAEFVDSSGAAGS